MKDFNLILECKNQIRNAKVVTYEVLVISLFSLLLITDFFYVAEFLPSPSFFVLSGTIIFISLAIIVKMKQKKQFYYNQIKLLDPGKSAGQNVILEKRNIIESNIDINIINRGNEVSAYTDFTKKLEQLENVEDELKKNLETKIPLIIYSSWKDLISNHFDDSDFENYSLYLVNRMKEERKKEQTQIDPDQQVKTQQ